MARLQSSVRFSITGLALALVFTSCAFFAFHGKDMGRLSLGMSKAEVMHQLGKPNRGASSRDNVEILHYVDQSGWQFGYYFVRLVDGKVESFGSEPKHQPVTESNPPVKK